MLVFVVALFGYPAYLVLRTSVASGDGLDSGGFSLTHYVTFFSDSLYLDAPAEHVRHRRGDDGRRQRRCSACSSPTRSPAGPACAPCCSCCW